MPNPRKAKGDRYERDVERMCHDAGWPDAKRTRPGRGEDHGDILLDPAAAEPTILQAKDVATPQWRQWLDELEIQKACAGARHGALVVKRRGTGGRPPLHLAVMPLDKYLDLVKEASDG